MQGRIHTILILLCLVFSTLTQAREYPFIDAHTHYNDNVWDGISPQNAIERLKKVGIKQAVVSSTSDEGTQRLFKADPEFTIRSLRPYRDSDDRLGWAEKPDMIPYLKSRLEKYEYVAIGEFHIHGKQADLPVIREIIQLARQYNLLLHIHSDADAIRRVFKHDPEARVVWAHAGFEYASTVEEMMDQHENLYADLSFRREIYINNQFLQTWRTLLIKHADRFMVGVDTYIPERWLQLDDIMQHFTQMLDALPEDVANRIAFQNARRIYQQ